MDENKQINKEKVHFKQKCYNFFVGVEEIVTQKLPYYYWWMCVLCFPFLIIMAIFNSCSANNHLTDTLNKHEEVLSTLEKLVSISTSEDLAQIYKDSLVQITKQAQGSYKQNNDSLWIKSSIGDIVVPVTLNIPLKDFSQELKETSEKLQACGKWFFDSNTVTFLICLIVVLLIAIITDVQSKMKESLEENKKTFDGYKVQIENLNKESQETFNDYKDKIENIKNKSQKTFDGYKDQITNDSQSMNLYIRIYALFNISITIRQFLKIYLTKKENIDLLPELVYQANNSINDINSSLRNEFAIKKDLFDMMYKTLCASRQNLFFRETKQKADEETKQKADEETKQKADKEAKEKANEEAKEKANEEVNEELITTLLSDVTNNIDSLLKELEKRRTK